MIKGYHVLLIAVCGFGIVIAANLTMLFAATGSFPGLVVKNSYVASQQWNKRTDAQRALGWNASIGYSDGVVLIDLKDKTGQPITGKDLVVMIGRPTSDREDQTVAADAVGEGYRAFAKLAPGQWQIQLSTKQGPAYRVTTNVYVRP